MCCRSKHDYSSRAQSIYSPNVEGELYMWFLRQSQSRRPRNTCYLQVSVIKFRASGGRRALSPLTTLSSREDWRGKKAKCGQSRHLTAPLADAIVIGQTKTLSRILFPGPDTIGTRDTKAQVRANLRVGRLTTRGTWRHNGQLRRDQLHALLRSGNCPAPAMS